MIGSDFELFMKTADTGEFIPEFFLNLPDKGEEHVQLDLKGKHVGFIHRDNVSVELCSLVSTPQGFANSVRDTILAGQAWLNVAAPGLVLGQDTTVVLDKAAQQHPNAQELGCDIDYVSDMVKQESIARQALHAGLLGENRHAGGHVHVSYDYELFPAWMAARICDLFIGLPMQATGTLDIIRGQWYGNLSLHRSTRYPNGAGGVEYRPLDSGWVHSDMTRELVAKGAGIVQNVMDAKNNDLVAQLLRVAAPLRAYQYLTDLPADLCGDLNHEAMQLARPVSEWIK